MLVLRHYLILLSQIQVKYYHCSILMWSYCSIFQYHSWDTDMNCLISIYHSLWTLRKCIKVICLYVQSLSHIWLFVTSWTVAHQIPLSIGLSRQKYCSGLPFLPPEDLPDPGIELTSPSLGGIFFTTELLGKSQNK